MMRWKRVAHSNPKAFEDLFYAKITMNKEEYEKIQTAAFDEAIASLIDQNPQLFQYKTRFSSVLSKLQHVSTSNARAYELLNLKDSAELAELWGVNMSRVTAHCRTLHEKHGIGRKFGKTWVLTGDEAERYRPRENAGVPAGSVNNPIGRNGRNKKEAS